MSAQASSANNNYSCSFPLSFPSRSSIYSVTSALINPTIGVGTETENQRGATLKGAVIASYSTSSVTIRRLGADCKVCVFIIGN